MPIYIQNMTLTIYFWIVKYSMYMNHQRSQAEDGMYAHRIVAYHRERPPFPERAYATHMEVFPDNGEMYRLNGHYDLTLEDAIKDAKTRYKLYGGE